MKIAVIDFKSVLSNDVFNTLKDINVCFDIFDNDLDISLLKDYDGIIFTGSHDHVYETGSRSININIFELNKPILGVCYGHQLVHHLLGGEVRKANQAEIGSILIETKDSKLFKDLPTSHHVYMYHYDEVVKLAPNFKCIAKTDLCEYAASENVDKKIYTIQFHPEAKENDFGKEVYMNFIDIVNKSL